MKFKNGQLPTTTTTDDNERLLRAELSLLMRNIATRTQRHRREGFKIPFERFAALCDDDHQLARRVLLCAGWCPHEDGGEWITGRGQLDIDRAISSDVLESTIESILDDYRPVEEARAAA